MDAQNPETAPDAPPRVFLFLQGPTSEFFFVLAQALRRLGHQAYRVNLVGGDVITWPSPTHTFSFHGRRKFWPSWIAGIIQEKGVTDLMLMGDWRALHIEAIDLARLWNLKIHVFEEGYLRPHYITLERGGVNGKSPLPHTPEEVRALAAACGEPPAARALAPYAGVLFWKSVLYHAASVLLFPLFLFYKNHRPNTPLKELFGWATCVLRNRGLPSRGGKLMAEAAAALEEIRRLNVPYYFFPLQLEGDSQVRRYSPFSGMLEAISHIMTSFARHAPPEAALLIKNHPLDNRLRGYATYVREYARVLGLSGRVYYVEFGNNHDIITGSRAVVLLNSTIGLSALSLGKPVYCLGRCIYAMPGLAASAPQASLDHFWRNHTPPDRRLLRDFIKVLRRHALINGNFYSREGIEAAVTGVLSRLGA